MNAGVTVAELQQIADLLQMRKTLRRAGLGSIVFGILAIFVGLLLLNLSAINLAILSKRQTLHDRDMLRNHVRRQAIGQERT